MTEEGLTPHQELTELRRSNAERLVGIQQQGATLDPTSVTMTRVNALIDFLYPQDSYERAEFELAFERDIQTILEKVEVQLRRAMLLAPGRVAPPGAGVPNLQGLLRPDGRPQ